MCNFIPVRNLLIAVGIIGGFAVTSVVFALMWERFGGLPLVTSISYSAASSWALATAVLLGFALNALTTFCTCAAAVPACTADCSSMATLLRSLLGLMFALFALCAVLAGDILELGFALRFAAMVAMASASVALVTMGIYASRLGSCQGP
jgi:hypothetical protein